MTIHLVDKSCSCERLDLPEQAAAPNEIATMAMLIHPPGKAEKKAYTATLKLVWQDHSEVVKLRSELEVLAELFVEPVEVRHDFFADVECERAFAVKHRVRSAAEPNSAEPNLTELPEEVHLVAIDHVGTRILKSGSEDRAKPSPEPLSQQEGGAIWEIEWRATLRLKMSERVRQGLDTQCMLLAGGPAASKVQIPIRLRSVQSIQIAPAYTYFGRLRPGEERKRMVLVRSLDDQEFELNDCSCDLPAFTTQVASHGAKKLHTLQVTFGGSVNGQRSGTIRVATTHPQCPEVRFGVEGRVEEGTRIEDRESRIVDRRGTAE